MILAERPEQGRVRVDARIGRRAGRFQVPAGSLWIPAAQPAFEVAVQLLEPRARDSLFAWGELSAVLEDGQNDVVLPVFRVLRPQPLATYPWH